MITTPSMGLKRWDQPNDIFSYTELSDNFNLLDLHDHTSAKGVQIPTGGLANLAVDTTKLANDAVTNAKILNSTIADAKLASPNNGAWRSLVHWSAKITPSETSGVTYLTTQGSGLLATGGSTSVSVLLFPFFPAHYSVAGKTLQWRLVVGGIVNATAPAITINFSLRPITSAGGASGNVAYTVGSIVGSALSFVSPSASSAPQDTITLTPPVQGIYGMGVTLSGTPAASSQSQWSAILQCAHV